MSWRICAIRRWMSLISAEMVDFAVAILANLVWRSAMMIHDTLLGHDDSMKSLRKRLAPQSQHSSKTRHLLKFPTQSPCHMTKDEEDAPLVADVENLDEGGHKVEALSISCLYPARALHL
jgi:hypothetical protein